jgi:hypothetical protein
MKKDVITMIALVLILESIYSVYASWMLFHTYWIFILYAAIVPALMTVAGVGLFFKKEWAVIVFWIAFAFPALDALLLGGFSVNGLNALISVINIAILIYLSSQKGRLSQ